MQFKSTHILLGFSTFLFAYSLNKTTDLWYAILLGFAVLVYYSFPRTSVIMRVYLLLGMCLVITLAWTAYHVLVFPLLFAIILTITYPWFRDIPWAKTPIIASSWTMFMLSVMSTSEALNLVSILVLLLLFGVLATAPDVKDSEIDSIRLKTLPQVMPWRVLRWVLFSIICVILGLTFFFLPNWLLGAIFFSAFSTYVLLRNWTIPISFDLDPGLLLFALGNLLYLR
jgi:hypothetical protein